MMGQYAKEGRFRPRLDNHHGMFSLCRTVIDYFNRSALADELKSSYRWNNQEGQVVGEVVRDG